MHDYTLWVAVLVQGLTDACGKFLWSSKKNEGYRQDALKWIGSKDFNLVCEFAGWESHQVKDIYSALSKHKHYLTTEDIRYLFNEALNRRSSM